MILPVIQPVLPMMKIQVTMKIIMKKVQVVYLIIKLEKLENYNKQKRLLINPIPLKPKLINHTIIPLKVQPLVVMPKLSKEKIIPLPIITIIQAIIPIIIQIYPN